MQTSKLPFYFKVLALPIFSLTVPLSLADDISISRCDRPGQVQLTQPGTYALTQDIDEPPQANGTCLMITSDSVTLNGNGHTISGNNTGGIGIWVNPQNDSNHTIENLRIENLTVSHLDYGFLLDTTNGLVFENVSAHNNGSAGFYFRSSCQNSLIANCKAYYNLYAGMILNSFFDNIVSGAQIHNNGTSGLSIFYGTGNTFQDSRIYNNGTVGLSLSFAHPNLFKNNFFKNTLNFQTDTCESQIVWNSALTPGWNIMGGPNLGGNFWSTPSGTGCSDASNCTDQNGDGICDTSCEIYQCYDGGGQGNIIHYIDYYPLRDLPPQVLDLNLSASLINEALNGDLVSATLTFSEEMDPFYSPALTFNPNIVTQGVLSFDSGTWSDDHKTYTASYVVHDTDQEMAGIDLSVAQAEDLSGNLLSSYTAANVLSVDTEAPGIQNIQVSPDPAVAGSVSVTVHFSETMNTGVAPMVQVLGLYGGPLSVNQVSFTGAAWSGTFILPDDEEEKTATIVVANARDTANNTMAPNPTAATFGIDTISPQISNLTISPNPAKAGAVSVDITFSEPMNTATIPTVQATGMAGAPLNVSQLSYSGTSWRGSFTLQDNDEEVEAHISVSGAKDLAGNFMADHPSAGTFLVDTKAPMVQNALLQPAISGPGLVTLNVTFSEDMNPSFAPTVMVHGLTGGSFAATQSSYSGQVWSGFFNVADSNEETQAFISISGARDIAGNQMINLPSAAVLTVDSKNPVVADLQVSKTALAKADDGSFWQTAITFSEEMDTVFNPQIVFLPDVVASGLLAFDEGGWLSNRRVYVAKYRVRDSGGNFAAVALQVTNARDLVGNTQVSYQSAGILDVDMAAPAGTIDLATSTGYSASAVVSITANASDTGSGLGFLRFSNDGILWSPWRTFATVSSWDITDARFGGTAQDGLKCVFVQFKDSAGNVSEAAQGTITLDRTAPIGSVALKSKRKLTKSLSVRLVIKAFDALSGLQSMRFSRDGQRWSKWLPFSTSLKWRLALGEQVKAGKKKVLVQFVDRVGNVSQAPTLSVRYRPT